MNSISTLPSGENKANGHNGTGSSIHQARAFGESGQSQPFQLNEQVLLGQKLNETTEQQASVFLDDEIPTPEDPQALLTVGEVIVSRQLKGTQLQSSDSHAIKISLMQQQGAQSSAMTKGLTDALQVNQHRSPTVSLAEITAVKAPVLSTQVESILAQTNSVSLLQSVVQPQTQALTSPNSLAANPSAVAQGAEWAAVKVDIGAGKWGEQMMQVLHDRVTLQAQQNMQEAKIRLDPPELGKLDLFVRVEGDRLSVQINANAAATREALIQVSERLRAELQSQNFVHVEVNVSSGDSQQQGSNQNYPSEGHIFSARDSSFVKTSTSQSEHWLSTQA